MTAPAGVARRFRPVPGRGGFVAAIVAAQVLTNVGSFALPALLPGYIVRWELSKTGAGWLVGIFFLAYVVAVPVLVALTDRLPNIAGDILEVAARETNLTQKRLAEALGVPPRVLQGLRS